MIQWHNGTMVQWYDDTVCNITMVQWYNGAMVHCYNGTIVQWYNVTMVQADLASLSELSWPAHRRPAAARSNVGNDTVIQR